MMAQPAAADGPAFKVVAPFLLAGPIGLFVAGLLLATSNSDAFAAINVPHTVAVTHAAVIGWLTTSIMGAIYQLGPAVLSGRLRSQRLARIQFVVHVVGVVSFVWTLLEWNVPWMGGAAILVVLSFILFLVNAYPAVVRAKVSGLPRAYLSVSLAFLVIAASFGITWVGTLEHLWFPVTLGRLGGHAHLGLVGWLALVIMGTSYQLVPMFNVVHKVKPRFGWWALGITSATALVAGIGLMTDPSRPVRMLFAVSLLIGPALWGLDIARLLQARFRRKMDIQGHATFVSLAFLALAGLLALAVAWGSPWLGEGEAARWQLAYGIAAIGGWAGTTLIGNSYKILPFLVWWHRYRELAGKAQIPVIADIYSDRLAHVTLAVHGGAIVILVLGALAGELALVRAGGLVLAGGAAFHFALLAHITFARHEARTPSAALREVTAR